MVQYVDKIKQSVFKLMFINKTMKKLYLFIFILISIQIVSSSTLTDKFVYNNQKVPVMNLDKSNIDLDWVNTYFLKNGNNVTTNFTNFIINSNLIVNGNFTGNQIYGEMWNRTLGTITTGFETIDLVTVDVYVMVKKLNCGNNNGFTCINGTGNLTAQVSGMYQINIASSVNEGAVTIYGMKIFVDNIGQNNCYNHFHTFLQASGNPTISCLVRINAGSNLSIGFDDHTNPVTDLILSSMNVNLWRIGN